MEREVQEQLQDLDAGRSFADMLPDDDDEDAEDVDENLDVHQDKSVWETVLTYVLFIFPEKLDFFFFELL